MWVVGYLWNTNGMASWCWEAAHALAEAGERVLLVCSHSAPLPGPANVPLLRFDPPARQPTGVLGKVSRELRRLSVRPKPFLGALHRELVARREAPTAYLLNSSEFPDPAVPAPQFVVGWAYPTTLAGYARKIVIHCRPSLSRRFVRAALDTLGWYRKDWNAYRHASGVMSVSARLDGNLRAAGVPSSVVHPGTATARGTSRPNPQAPFQLLLAAADLDEPRKRVGWMVDALATGTRRDLRLTFVGTASAALRASVARCGLQAEFVGSVPRDRVQDLMRDQDVLLFGSRLDDWGYVLVEAMSQGLAVAAPGLSPFDEIVGEGAGVLYDAYDPGSFRRAVYDAAGPDLPRLKATAAARATEKFSRAAFAASLLAAVRRADVSITSS